MRCSGHIVQELLSGSKTPVEQAGLLKTANRGLIVLKVVGLTPNWALPGKAEPGQILVNGSLKFRTASIFVDVFNPKKKPA